MRITWLGTERVVEGMRRESGHEYDFSDETGEELVRRGFAAEVVLAPVKSGKVVAVAPTSDEKE